MRKRFIANAHDPDPTAEYGVCVICAQSTRHKDDTNTVRLCRDPVCRSFKLMTEAEIKRTDLVACGLILEVPGDC